MTDVVDGVLLLADVSGYTRYLGGVELEHSHDILADLIGVVAENLTGPLRLAKLEGDAVFAWGAAYPGDGAELLGTIESCYFAFARRQRAIVSQTSCGCDACRRIVDLNLKFVVHHGSCVEHMVAGNAELVGADVILVHRRLKNDVGRSLAADGYALLTDACVRRLDIETAAAGMVGHRESYDDVGDVDGHALDLGRRWRDEQERAIVHLAGADADMTFETTVPVDQQTTWRVMTDPLEQEKWRVAVDRVGQAHPRGSRGAGTTTHCVHGPTTIKQEILDWKPPRYVSYTERNPIGRCLWTCELVPDEGGTRVAWRVKLTGGVGQKLVYAVVGGRMRSTLRANLDSLAAHLAGDAFSEAR